MYKKLKQYAPDHQLTVDEKNGLVYGHINGYFALISQNFNKNTSHIIQFWVKPGNTEPIPSIPEFANQLLTKYEHLQNINYDNGELIAVFDGKGKSYMSVMDAFLQELVIYFENNGIVTCCKQCGTENDLDLYQINGFGHVLCPACFANFSEHIENNQKELKKRGSGNIIGGIIGALLGSLIGVATWVLIYQLGYISALAGLIMVICAFKGYELLGGRLNLVGIIITCVICIAMVLVAEQTCMAIEIYNAYSKYEALSFFEAFRIVPEFLKLEEVSGAVAHDLIIGYLLMIVGAFSTIRQTFHKNAGKADTRLVTSVNNAPTEK